MLEKRMSPEIVGYNSTHNDIDVNLPGKKIISEFLPSFHSRIFYHCRGNLNTGHVQYSNGLKLLSCEPLESSTFCPVFKQMEL